MDRRGQSLLEVIIAMAIFALISVAMVMMATGGFTSLAQGGEHTEADALAQEAIEAVRSIRDNAWNKLIYTTSSVSISGNEWMFDGEGLTDTVGQYNRSIRFNDVCRDESDNITDCPGSYTDVHSKKVTVVVEWEVRSGINNSVRKVTYLTNWDSQEWVQTDWIGGDGQVIWSDTTQYDSSDSVVDVNTGQVTLDQTTDTSASTTWPFDTPSNYTYDTQKIEVTGGKAQLVGTAGGAGNTVDDGLEYTTETSVDWDFSTVGDYTYDSNDIEVTGGVAQLNSVGGSVVSGDTTNETFDSNSSGWTFNTWNVGPAEVTPTGSWQSSGGNPGGYININIPSNAKNDQVGGYWEQAISITENDSTVTCSFDWSVIDWTAGNGVDDYKVYIFLDSSSGVPTVGNQVWASATQSGITSWTGQQDIDCSSVASGAGTYYYKVAVWLDAKNKNTGPITLGFDNSKVHWEKAGGGSYPTDEPDIYPTASYLAPGVQSWDSFTETATKNSGEIYYQLSSDNGSTWQYWNGSGWNTAGVTDYNTASIVNTNISSFSTSTEQIKFKAFLESDGTQLVQLDNINIGFTPSPSVWSFATWDVDGGEVTPTGQKQASGGNLDSYGEITVSSGNNDEVGGYWVQSFTTTEDNPDITIDFDYKMFDFNASANISEIRIYVDTASGEPVSQVGDAISLTAEGDWASATTISSSTAIGTAGTYYLKIAYWVETPVGGGGPFTVGFDNVDLSWQSSGYPTDKPTIYNLSSFTPAAVEQWTGFVEIATKNSGEIYYQLSNDDGATWLYWDGDSWETAGASNYNTASVINSAIQYFDTTAKKLMFKAFLESDGTQQVQLDDIYVTYEVSSVSYIGNRFVIESTSGAGLMSNSSDKFSLRFTAENSKTVSGLRVYLDDLRGTSPTYRFGLQSDSSSQPSGTWLGGTNMGYGDFQPASTGWQSISLNESVSLTAGDIYHLVIEYQSGTINAGNAIELRQSNPETLLHASDGSADIEANILYSDDSGGTWTVQNYQPIYVLDFSDVSFEGNPYHRTTEHEVYGDNYHGQEFTISGSYVIVSTVGAYVSENNQGPEADMIMSFYNVTDDVFMASSTLTTADQIRNGVYIWQEFFFEQPLTLEVDKTYRLYISAPDADVTAHYLVRSVSNNDNAVYNSINYDSTDSFFIFSVNAGTDWTGENNSDLAGFRFQQTIFTTAGYVISSGYDMGFPSVPQIIEWDMISPTCSTDCTVKLQIQTASDSGGSPGTWSSTWCGPEGEDGDETDYFTINTGELIHTDHIGDQWIRYKASLIGDSTDTPTLEEVRVNYK